MKMRTDDFDYSLPNELIAQYPSASRKQSRMLVVSRRTGRCECRAFSDLPEYLDSGDAVIFNNTRVMNARMYGEKAETGARIEILQVNPVRDSEENVWKCLVKPGKRVKVGTIVRLQNRENEISDYAFEVIDRDEEGLLTIRFNAEDNQQIQDACGHVPLPPYIKRRDEPDDFERYQTVYARVPGAVAAPTAGLHFSNEIIDRIRERGVLTSEVTLHVGPGTFKPVGTEFVQDHQMHEETFVVTQATADLINQVHDDRKRVLAVGTTVVRVLESVAGDEKGIRPCHGSTDIFIHPPCQVRAVDMLLTNFHLPRSTLLMLVCAFAGKDHVMKAYELAVKEKFRFYSYGDCMLLI